MHHRGVEGARRRFGFHGDIIIEAALPLIAPSASRRLYFVVRAMFQKTA